MNKTTLWLADNYAALIGIVGCIYVASYLSDVNYPKVVFLLLGAAFMTPLFFKAQYHIIVWKYIRKKVLGEM